MTPQQNSMPRRSYTITRLHDEQVLQVTTSIALTIKPPMTDPTTIPAIWPPLRPPSPSEALPAAVEVLVGDPVALVVEEGLALRVYPHGRKSVFAIKGVSSSATCR